MCLGWGRSHPVLLYDIHAHPRFKDGRNFYCAVGLLIVLDDSGDDAWKGECGTIEGVAKLDRLVVGATIAALQTVGLIGVEIGNRRHFKPTLLSLGINLKVVADGTGEALVTTAKTQDAVRQFELLEQPLDMFEHLAM